MLWALYPINGKTDWDNLSHYAVMHMAPGSYCSKYCHQRILILVSFNCGNENKKSEEKFSFKEKKG